MKEWTVVLSSVSGNRHFWTNKNEKSNKLLAVSLERKLLRGISIRIRWLSAVGSELLTLSSTVEITVGRLLEKEA